MEAFVVSKADSALRGVAEGFGTMSDGARAKKLGELVAHRLTQEIIDRGWPVGQLIGREHELMLQHGVSRSTVREAIRQLERTGVAQMKRGIGGGLLVAAQPGAAASGVLATYLELICRDDAEVSDARLLLERLATRVLAERIDDHEAERLRAHAAEPPPARLPLSAYNRFRSLDQALIEHSANPALLLFIGSLDEMADRMTPAGDRIVPGDLLARTFRERAELVEAIIGRDWTAMDRLVERRVRTYSEVLEAARGAQAQTRADASRSQKLSHAVAHQIVQDFKSGVFKPGDALGLETEVQVRYGVGRGVLREALRILEPHGLLQIRSGSSGGVLVGRPNPAYTLDLLLTCLRYMRLRMRDLWLVQAELETYATALAARRASPEGVENIRRAAENAAAAPLDTALQHGLAFHKSIIAECGNPVLELFGYAMLDYGAIALPPVDAEVTRAANEIGLRMAEAVANRDEMFARRCMDGTFSRSREWLRASGS